MAPPAPAAAAPRRGALAPRGRTRPGCSSPRSADAEDRRAARRAARRRARDAAGRRSRRRRRAPPRHDRPPGRTAPSFGPVRSPDGPQCPWRGRRARPAPPRCRSRLATRGRRPRPMAPQPAWNSTTRGAVRHPAGGAGHQALEERQVRLPERAGREEHACAVQETRDTAGGPLEMRPVWPEDRIGPRRIAVPPEAVEACPEAVVRAHGPAGRGPPASRRSRPARPGRWRWRARRPPARSAAARDATAST